MKNFYYHFETSNEPLFRYSNLHDYSYEAQVRKDVAFGAKINDFYDKRPSNKINFRDHPLNKATDADLVLARYKNEVEREYEIFFDAVL